TPTATPTATVTASATATTTAPAQLPQPEAPKVKLKKRVLTVSMKNTPGVSYVVRLRWTATKVKKPGAPKVRIIRSNSSVVVLKNVAKGNWNVSYYLVSLNPGILDSRESVERKVSVR
ncbi:MAG: hypothetical protein EBZ48_07695, partial [Proteobacteria bacterium]|nr:hypothetical protein [Pseudomonadota bacterium]